MGKDNLSFYVGCDYCKIGFIYSVVAVEVHIAVVALTASVVVIDTGLLVYFQKRKR